MRRPHLGARPWILRLALAVSTGLALPWVLARPGTGPDGPRFFCQTAFFAHQAEAALYLAPLMTFVTVPIAVHSCRRAESATARVVLVAVSLFGVVVGLAAWQRLIAHVL